MPDCRRRPSTSRRRSTTSNDAPHIGHAYTTVAADVARPVAAPLGRRRRVPHRHRRARPQDPAGGRGPGRHPAGVGRPQQRAVPRAAWDAARHHLRRLHPHHRAPPLRAVQEFLQRVYDNGDIELDTYEGLYCVGCEVYYTEDELDDGLRCPIHGTPVEHVTEENYFFRLSRFEDRLLEHYTEHPEAVQPDGEAQRGARASSSRGCSTSRSAARRSRGASRSRGTTEHVTYVWFDALFNYCTAVGYPDDRDAVRPLLAGRLPPHRQGHPPVRTRCTGPRC